MNQFVRELLGSIERHHLLAPRDKVVVGVSGGGDSIALLHGLHAISRMDNWAIQLHVAHLHHGIRGSEADADEQFVKEQAAALHLPYSVGRVNVPAEAQRLQMTLEEAARFCRYTFFEQVCRQVGAAAVAVAHHADDNAETVVQRLFRGTALRGLAGMRPKRPLSTDTNAQLIRPLLPFRRETIIGFMQRQNIPFRQDSTNDATKITRNRIRHEILPLIEKSLNPHAVDALQRLAEHAAGLHDHLAETAEKLLATLIVQEGDGELVLDATGLVKKRWVVQTEIIRQAYLRVYAHERDLTFRHLSAVTELAADPSSGKSLDLPGGIRVAKSYHKLIFAKPDPGKPRETVELMLNVPGHTVLAPYDIEIDAEIIDNPQSAAADIRTQKPDCEEWLDWDTITPPMVVRGRHAGDRFWPLGMPADKRLAEFLIDHKVPKEDRDRVAVLCDQKGPLWVIPFRIDQRTRVTEQTRRVLKLRCRPR